MAISVARKCCYPACRQRHPRSRSFSFPYFCSIWIVCPIIFKIAFLECRIEWDHSQKWQGLVTKRMPWRVCFVHVSFNQSLDNVTWLAGLQSLTGKHFFNQRLDNVIWPAGLQNLTRSASASSSSSPSFSLHYYDPQLFRNLVPTSLNRGLKLSEITNDPWNIINLPE